MQPLTHSHTSEIRERIRRVKARKLLGWDKDSLIRESKSCAHQQSKTRNEFSAAHGQAGVQPSPGEQGPITCNGEWEDKHHCSKCPPFFLLPPNLYSQNDVNMVWNVPLVSWGHLPWLCHLQASHVPPASPQAWLYEKQKKALALLPNKSYCSKRSSLCSCGGRCWKIPVTLIQ